MSPIETAAHAAEAAWSELREHLEARAQAIGAEVRLYPTPIAACDVQLSELIERRTRVFERLGAMREAGVDDARMRRDAMNAFLSGPVACAGDPEEERLRERLRSALHPSIDLDAYFARVGFAGPGAPDLATLQRLHALHVAAIPFENLSAFLGEPIALDVGALQEKLVGRGRGGWCFEQNLLFAHVLEALGFGVKRLAARVRWGMPAGVVTSRSHMLMQVDVAGEPYIADVGFGGITLTAPLRLRAGVEQATAHEPHRLVAEPGALVLEAKVAGDWQALYAFEPHEQQLADYEVSNWYLAHHPASIFVNGVLAARAEPGRRYALRNTRFAIHAPDGTTQRQALASVGELREALTGPLRIALPPGPDLDRKLAAMLEREAGR